MNSIHDQKYLQLKDLTIDQYKYYMENIYNGVGSKEYLINPRDFIFKKAAEYHDFRYFSGGTNENRIEADDEYDKYANQAISEEPNAIKRYFYRLVHIVYMYFLRKLGKNAWEYYPEPSYSWEEFIERFNKTKSKNKLTWLRVKRDQIFL